MSSQKVITLDQINQRIGYLADKKSILVIGSTEAAANTAKYLAESLSEEPSISTATAEEVSSLIKDKQTFDAVVVELEKADTLTSALKVASPGAVVMADNFEKNEQKVREILAGIAFDLKFDSIYLTTPVK